MALVDELNPNYGENLEKAVEYLNDASTPILEGHRVNLTVLMTKDNDSIGAMEMGMYNGIHPSIVIAPLAIS